MTMRVITDLESLPSLRLAAAESPIIPVYRAFGHSNQQKPHRELASALVREVYGHSRRVVHSEGSAPTIVGDGPKGFLSVASRGPWAVAVVANGPIGVDIEDRTSREDIPWELLSEPEVSWLHEQHDRLRWHRFLDLWVAKESVAKASETARSVAPRDVTISWNGSMDFAGESSLPCEGRLYYELSSMPQWVVGLASKT